MPDPSLDDDLDLDALDAPTNDNFIAVRKYARKMEQKFKAEVKAHGETSTERDTLKAEQSSTAVKAAAKAKGLSDEQVEAFLSFKPDATTEQVDAFVKMFGTAPPAPTEGDGDGADAGEGTKPPAGDSGQAPGFVPSGGGSSVPPKPFSQEDIDTAVKRGDKSTLERIAAEAVKDPSKLALKWAHLIEDD